MRQWLSLGVALGIGLAFADTASAQVKLGVAGPITGGSAAFGAQLKNGVEQAVEDINAAGGILGQKIQLFVGDDRADPKEGVSVANKFVGDGVKFVIGHFNSGVTIPASEVYQENGILESHRPRPIRGHRTQHVEHLPHLRPRRPAGRGRRRVHPQEVQGQEDRRHPRQDDLRPGSRRRDQGDDQQGRHEGSALRGRQQGRQGLLRPGLQDQGVRRRPHLLGRAARHRRPDPAPDARPGRQGAADGRRRHHRRRVRLDRRPRRRRHADDLRSRSAQAAGGQGRGRANSAPRTSSRRPTRSTAMPPSRSSSRPPRRRSRSTPRRWPSRSSPA